MAASVDSDGLIDDIFDVLLNQHAPAAVAAPVTAKRDSFPDVVRRRGQQVYDDDDNDNNDDDDNDNADVDDDLAHQMAAKMHQLQLDLIDQNLGEESLPNLSPVASPLLEEPDLTAESALRHLVLVLDVGTHQTKLGVAVADARQAWEVSDAPFLRVCTALTRELFQDWSVGDRLAQIVFRELVPLPDVGADRLREFQRVLLAFPGFYFHGSAEMRFTPVFHAWSPVWNQRFNAVTLASVLGVDERRLTFMNSRTASGWAFIERFGSGERLGLVVTMGANTGVFGVWRGLMCFTRPQKKEDRAAAAAADATLPMASRVFDAGHLRLRDGRTVSNALRFELGAAPLAPALLAECIEVAGKRLLELSAGTAAALRVAPPTSVVVVLAGGGATRVTAEFVRTLEQDVSRAWHAHGVSAQLEVAPNAVWNDLRGALYFARLVAPRADGNAARLQEVVDRPSALFVEQQLFRHDVATELVAYCANFAQAHPSHAAAMKTSCKWLLSRRRATLMTAVDSERAHAALDDLLLHSAFIGAFAQIEDERAEGQCAFRFVQSERDLALPDAMLHNMCGWIAAHWRELALALVGAAATDALELLADVLLNTPPPPPRSGADGSKSLLAKLKWHVFASGQAAPPAASVQQRSRVATLHSARAELPPIAGVVFGGRRPKPSRVSAQLIELFGGVEKRGKK